MIISLATLSDIVGIIGVAVLLIAYFLLNINKISAHTLHYQLANFFSSCGILFSLYFHWNTASVIIETAWIIISMIGIYNAINILKGRKNKPSNLYVISDMNKREVDSKSARI